MDQPSNAPFNLDSFIRKRADEQRQQQGSSTTKPATPPAAKIPSPPLPATPESDGTVEIKEAEAKETPQPLNRPAAAEVSKTGQRGNEATETLKQSTQSAQQSQQAAQEAVDSLQNDVEDSQARMAAEAAQEAAQASLEAIEFAHQATRSAIEEATQGRQQKRTYNTHRLLVILNISLLVAAFAALYLFIWPGGQFSPFNDGVNHKTTEHLTQQLLLDTQRERLRSEQELALMEQSLARLVQEQESLKTHLDETKSLLNSERQRSQQEQTMSLTFNKMEQDLKQRIAELEKRLERKEQPQIIVTPPTAAPTVPVATAQPVAPQPAPKAVLSETREKEVDQILQKLYSLHSELSEQKETQTKAAPTPTPTEPVNNRPYSYNRR